MNSSSKSWYCWKVLTWAIAYCLEHEDCVCIAAFYKQQEDWKPSLPGTQWFFCVSQDIWFFWCMCDCVHWFSWYFQQLDPVSILSQSFLGPLNREWDEASQQSWTPLCCMCVFSLRLAKVMGFYTAAWYVFMLICFIMILIRDRTKQNIYSDCLQLCYHTCKQHILVHLFRLFPVLW